MVSLSIKAKFILKNIIGWSYKMLKYLIGYFHLQEIHTQIQYYLNLALEEIKRHFII